MKGVWGPELRPIREAKAAPSPQPNGCKPLALATCFDFFAAGSHCKPRGRRSILLSTISPEIKLALMMWPDSYSQRRRRQPVIASEATASKST